MNMSWMFLLIGIYIVIFMDSRYITNRLYYKGKHPQNPAHDMRVCSAMFQSLKLTIETHSDW